MAKAPIISPDNSGSSATDSKGGAPVGKGHATPTRREREKANQRPLVAKGKEAQKAQRDRVAAERERARIGMANGEEKYMPARDRGPQRRFVRDYVDARFSVGELLIPAMVVVLVLTAVPAVSAYGTYIIWGYLILAIIDIALLVRRLNRKLAAKFGASNAERGLTMYVATRAASLRIMRTPRPQVKRGQFPQE
ncbi:DUF3043 domain-containing protein [Frondihabitans australicus]|uniref:DUF3043 family protein n=1 Tax=Frondihabitans australicus TaxID=386892 RepID=A0A495IE80_9MICO|nr:DUF3043 domain-containing protein [Frondihabitans australicus]RKR74292.1 hypothetical protein C8E83_1401 [Frondihabitans australicus]